jgi:NAD-dependent SIR2 family protein deacetylase
MYKGVVCYCKVCEGEGKKSPLKPAAVWFGERMPERFFKEMANMGGIDLLIVMGTSMKVKPFC